MPGDADDDEDQEQFGQLRVDLRERQGYQDGAGGERRAVAFERAPARIARSGARGFGPGAEGQHAQVRALHGAIAERASGPARGDRASCASGGTVGEDPCPPGTRITPEVEMNCT